MKIHLIKGLDGKFTPAYDSDRENAKKLKSGEEFEFEVKRPRNIKFHRKFFALINLVYDNQERYNNIDHLRKDLTVEAGFYELRYGIYGEEIKEAKSISFAKMDEVEFSELYSLFLDVIAIHFHFKKEEINEYIEQYF